MNEKQKIILYYTKDNMSQREISRRTGVARDTIRKYIREYESKVQELGYALSDIEKADLIEEITKKPKYKSSPRTKTAVTDEVIEKIKTFLKENEIKRLKGFSKQQMKKIDMHEALLKEGFNISYSSVISVVNKLEKTKKEAFIKEEKRKQARKIEQKAKGSSKKKSTEGGGRLAHQKSIGSKEKKMHNAAKSLENRIAALGKVEAPEGIRRIRFRQSKALELHNPYPIVGAEINKV
ncbi:TPA: helix-turn-helix domain-containing protein, partial [Streptococcus suis]|nr:helix-turn-helix domain-containing protein [Streptococcus suis]